MMFKLLFTVSFLFSTIAHGQSTDSCHFESTKSKHMKSVRIDFNAPCKCKPFRIEQFNNKNIEYFVEGIKTTKGADRKIDISREGARTLWVALNPNKAGQNQKQLQIIKSSKKMTKLYNLLLDTKDDMGFDFKVEGEILEALAIIDLEDVFPTDKYFITGGISYFGKSQTLGELDLVVYEKSTCKVISVGEAKLSRKTNKALKQLARFKQFLQDRLH